MTGVADRKLAAIVALDVAGFSRMIENDEAATLARMNAIRRHVVEPSVLRNRGRLVKSIGDGLLLEFPSAVDAVRAAVEIQEAQAARNASEPVADRILYRIGINIGDVVVDGGDLLGDGVNVAARLEALAEPGGICISDTVHEQLAGRIALQLADIGPQRLKNIARPIRAWQWLPSGFSGRRSQSRRWRIRFQRLGRLAAVLAAVAISAAGIWWLAVDRGRDIAGENRAAVGSNRLESRGKTAVAVLPFADLGRDPALEYFSAGMTEDVIGALGRFSGISVLSRNAVMPYKDKIQRPEQIARSLGVRYLVEGTIRHGKNRVLISVQLSDARAGRLLWSQQFDSELRDHFVMQETIARWIVGALAVRLTKAEQERATSAAPQNPEAYDLVLRARAQLARRTRLDNVEARQLFQRAIALEPRYADAYVGLGESYRAASVRGWVADADDALTEAEKSAHLAIRHDETSSRAYALLGHILAMRQRYDQAIEASRRAIQLNPSDAEGYFGLGAVMLWSSRISAAIDALETGRAYDPTVEITSIINLSLAYYLAARPADAVNLIETTVGRESDAASIPLILSLSFVELGRLDEAKAMAALARRRLPAIDREQFGSLLLDPAHRARIRDGLKKAGLL